MRSMARVDEMLRKNEQLERGAVATGAKVDGLLHAKMRSSGAATAREYAGGSLGAPVGSEAVAVEVKVMPQSQQGPGQVPARMYRQTHAQHGSPVHRGMGGGPHTASSPVLLPGTSGAMLRANSSGPV